MTTSDFSKWKDDWNSVDTAMRTFLRNLCGAKSVIVHDLCAHDSAVTNTTQQPLEGMQRIHLNVGGTSFSTTEEVLRGGSLNGTQESFFSMMLRNRDSFSFSLNTEGEREYFIDRSPSVFSYVLDYLRSPTRALILEDDVQPHQQGQLLEELDFYSIPKHRVILKKLQWRCADIKQNSDVIGFDSSSSTIWKKQDRILNKFLIVVLCNCLHTVTTNNTVRWRFRTTGKISNWFLGVSHGDSSQNSKTWIAVDMAHGTLYDQVAEVSKAENNVFPAQFSGVIEFLYCRSEGSLTITIGSSVVKRKLNPLVAADPHPCVAMNPDSSNTSVSVELLTNI